MPGFQFELSQLVNVPGKDQQGRVSGRMEFVNEETLYQVKWLMPDLSIDVGMFKEAEIVQAQPSAALGWLPENSFIGIDVAGVDKPGVTVTTRKRRTSKRKSRR